MEWVTWLEIADVTIDLAVLTWLSVRLPRVGIGDRTLLVFLASLAGADLVGLATGPDSALQVVVAILVLAGGLVALGRSVVSLIPRVSRPGAGRVLLTLAAAVLTGFLAAVAVEARLPEGGPTVRLGLGLLAGWLALIWVVARGLVEDSRRRSQHWQAMRESTLGHSLIALALAFAVQVGGWALGAVWVRALGIVFGTGAVVGIAVSYVPPRWLLAVWSREDALWLAEANRDLIRYAATPSDLFERAITDIVGLYDAHAAALLDADGRELARTGPADPLDAALAAVAASHRPGNVRVVPLPRASGGAELVLVLNRFTPFLGDDWASLLEPYSTALGEALDRIERTSGEREALDRSVGLLAGLERHLVGVVRVEAYRVVGASGIFSRPGWRVWEPFAHVGADVRDIPERSDGIGGVARMFGDHASEDRQRTLVHVDGVDGAAEPTVYDCSVSLHGPGGGVLLVQDVSALHAAERVAEARHRRLEQAEAVAALGSWEWDVARNTVVWSDELCRLFGEDPAVHRPSLEHYRSRIDPRDRDAADAAVGRALEDHSPWQLTYRIRRTDGEVRWLESRGRVASVAADGTVQRLQGTCRDVTDEQARLDDLLRHRRHLQHLSHRLVSAQEEERRQIALRLHDELGQVVTGLDLQLAGAAGPVDGIADVRRGLRELHDRIRDLAHGLRPPALEDLGLADAVRWLARRAQERLGIDVVVDAPSGGLDDVAMDRRLAAYRIVQESLTNAARHVADATVHVSILRVSDTLLVEVSDDGPGFDPEQVREDATGLSGMRERATAVGGQLEVLTASTGGTLIRARLPLTSGDGPSVGDHAARTPVR